jgi:copper chaperone CopZ
VTHDDFPVHTSQYRVQGMTCQHCVDAVTAEVVQLPGVTGTTIDLATGALEVRSAPEVSRDQVAAAVDEAGYVLADS